MTVIDANVSESAMETIFEECLRFNKPGEYIFSTCVNHFKKIETIHLNIFHVAQSNYNRILKQALL